MWDDEQLVYEALPAFARAFSPSDGTSWEADWHKVEGRWLLVVTFADLPMMLTSVVVTEQAFARAVACAEARGGATAENVGLQLHGVVESEEGEESPRSCRGTRREA